MNSQTWFRASLHEGSSKSLWLLFGVSVIVYAVVICVLWGYYGLYNGFNGETGLIVPSDRHPGLSGFLYDDPLRAFTSFFYHLSYLLGAAVGERGSFVPYQLVYAGLWVGRCVLTYAIVRKLLPDEPALAAIAGMSVALLANDSSLNWIGQLNQFGFIFWMLCGFLAYICALRNRIWWSAAGLAILSAVFGYLCLWSYESPLPVCAAFPLFVALQKPCRNVVRWVLTTAIYMIPIAAFIYLNLQRYMGSFGGATYQASILRSDFSLSAVLSDLPYHLKNAFLFWTWPNTAWNDRLSVPYIRVFAVIAISVGVLSWTAISFEIRTKTRHDRDKIVALTIGGMGLLVASYLVAVLIAGNTMFWRTEFLANFATALVLAGVWYLLQGIFRGGVSKFLITATPLFFMGFASSLAGVNTGYANRERWDAHRQIVASIVAQLPQIADGTLIVLRNFPDSSLAFGHNMWFDLALRAAYPNQAVGGIFYLQNGAPAVGVNIRIQGGRALPASDGFPTYFHTSPRQSIGNIVVFDFDPTSREARLVEKGPVSVGDEGGFITDYHPCAAVTGSEPNEVAVHRYGPITTTEPTPCVGGRSTQ